EAPKRPPDHLVVVLEHLLQPITARAGGPIGRALDAERWSEGHLRNMHGGGASITEIDTRSRGRRAPSPAGLRERFTAGTEIGPAAVESLRPLAPKFPTRRSGRAGRRASLRATTRGGRHCADC